MSKSVLSPKYHFQIVQTSGRIKIRLKDIVFFHFRSHENRETQTMKKVLHEQLLIKLSVYLLCIMAQNNWTINMLLLSIIYEYNNVFEISNNQLKIVSYYVTPARQLSCCCWIVDCQIVVGKWIHFEYYSLIKRLWMNIFYCASV